MYVLHLILIIRTYNTGSPEITFMFVWI